MIEFIGFDRGKLGLEFVDDETICFGYVPLVKD
jgi:hypothetical protein